VGRQSGGTGRKHTSTVQVPLICSFHYDIVGRMPSCFNSLYFRLHGWNRIPLPLLLYRPPGSQVSECVCVCFFFSFYFAVVVTISCQVCFMLASNMFIPVASKCKSAVPAPVAIRDPLQSPRAYKPSLALSRQLRGR